MSLGGEQSYRPGQSWLTVNAYKSLQISDLVYGLLVGELHLYFRPGSASRR